MPHDLLVLGQELLELLDHRGVSMISAISAI